MQVHLAGRKHREMKGTDLASSPGAENGVDTTGLSVRFLADNPTAGAYTVHTRHGFTGNDGVAEAALE